MFSHPGKQIFVVHTAICYTQADLYDILISAVQADAVDFQKCEHHIDTDSLISIDKGMVGNQVIAQLGTLLFLGGIKLLTTKAGKSSLKSRL